MTMLILCTIVLGADQITRTGQSLLQNDYQDAQSVLEKSALTPHNAYLLSLLYRLHEQYEQEKKLVEQALKQFPNDAYMQNRQQWHKRSMFDKTVPRKPVHLPRNPETTPRTETMKQLCIVTAADKNYFTLLVELIESLKATRFYKDIPICIIDCGLTTEQKKRLKDQWSIVDIKEPDWDIPAPPNTPKHLKSILCRPYLSKHFPDFRFYLWIDADIWIQDERILDRFVCLCEKQGWSLCQETFSNLIMAKFHCLHWKNLGRICLHKILNGGLFCVDKHTPYFAKWQFAIQHQTTGLQYSDQSSANLVFYTHRLTPLMRHENYIPSTAGLPVVDHNNILRNPFSFEPIGALHLAGHSAARHLQHPIYYYPTIRTDKPLNTIKNIIHYAQSTCRQHLIKDNAEGSNTISLRYRVWPDDKAALKATLQQEANRMIKRDVL